jgi:acyl-CoA synthetase (AMP-forming)/AMP-acid ligase II
MNRLLLHGARYHDRPQVFRSPEGETPDWRADRHAVRAGLALESAFAVGPGDVVALLLPLSVEWAFIERGIWGLGAASLPLWPEWGDSEIADRLERERPKVLVSSRSVGFAPAQATPGELFERGGALDTPERASRFRAVARTIPPEAIASLEPAPGHELSHAIWIVRVREFLERHPPRRGLEHVVEGQRPGLEARIVMYSGWADGLTTVVLGAPPREGGRESRRFANLGREGC